jgi:excisionase family DNA binding protein
LIDIIKLIDYHVSTENGKITRMSPDQDPNPAPRPPSDDCTTVEVARRLGMAVRSVQLMVDRGELEAWKTPGGHRRISLRSVERRRRCQRRRRRAPRSLVRAAPACF